MNPASATGASLVLFGVDEGSGLGDKYTEKDVVQLEADAPPVAPPPPEG